jgi:hypothetical protein
MSLKVELDPEMGRLRYKFWFFYMTDEVRRFRDTEYKGSSDLPAFLYL